MFRFRVRTLLVSVTVSAFLISFLVAQWKEGQRHEKLQRSLMQRNSLVEMSHQKSATVPRKHKGLFGRPQTQRVSTLPGFLESVGLATLFRRIEDITLYTYGKDNDEIDRLLSEVRSVGSFHHLFIAHGNITNQQASELVSDIPIQWLTVNTETLKASNGSWLAKKELKLVHLYGEPFDKGALEMLPTSIEKLQFDCFPDGYVRAADFDRFQSLQEVEFMTPSQPKLAEVLKASHVSQAFVVVYFGKRL